VTITFQFTWQGTETTHYLSNWSTWSLWHIN
jgi:hypothetical protein